MSRPTPRFLVTAGSTREMIDRVRDWGNIFTGNTGFAIARALADVGEVDLLTSNRQHVADAQKGLGAKYRVLAAPFTSHTDLKSALAQRMSAQAYDAVFMTAAVADYKPAGVFAVLDVKDTADGTQTRSNPATRASRSWVNQRKSWSTSSEPRGITRACSSNSSSKSVSPPGS
jgi:phosphopantothenoylcysteine synthetase/decarboxylase